MSKEAAMIIGVVVAILNGIVVVAGLGEFDDGFQAEDLVPIIAPVLGALGIRQAVFSQDTVAQIQAEQSAAAPPTGAGRSGTRYDGR